LKLAPPPARLRAETPKENTPCFSDLRAGKFFLKKERAFFFRGFRRVCEAVAGRAVSFFLSVLARPAKRGGQLKVSVGIFLEKSSDFD